MLSPCSDAALRAAFAAGGSYGISCSKAIAVTKPLVFTGTSLTLTGLKTGQGITAATALASIVIVKSGSVTLNNLAIFGHTNTGAAGTARFRRSEWIEGGDRCDTGGRRRVRHCGR